MNDQTLQAVKVENPRRHNKVSNPEKHKMRQKSSNARSSEFVYVNNAYVGGSMSSVNDGRIQEPPTSVIREQYWACSKWSFAQRVLAVLVGILLGAVIGLAIALVLKEVTSDDSISAFFRS